jgi:putative endonuclease
MYKVPAGYCCAPAAAAAAWVMIAAVAKEVATMFSRRSAATDKQVRGDAAEARALAHLVRHGLTLVERNYRVARGPHARGGELDLILRERDGTLVFVEVRARADPGHGGAAASVGAAKRASLVLAARHFLLRFNAPPPCRFDVVAIDGGELLWIRGAFDTQ